SGGQHARQSASQLGSLIAIHEFIDGGGIRRPVVPLAPALNQMPIEIFTMPEGKRLSAEMRPEAHGPADHFSSFHRQIGLTASLIAQYHFEPSADQILQGNDNARTVSPGTAALGRNFAFYDVVDGFVRSVGANKQDRRI